MSKIRLIPFGERFIISNDVADYFSHLTKKYKDTFTEEDLAEMKSIISYIRTFMDNLEAEVDNRGERLLRTGFEVGYDMGYIDKAKERNYDPHPQDYETLVKARLQQE